MAPATIKPKEYRSLIAIPVYVVLCLLLLTPFREIIDPDDASYLKIAERYAAGDWKTAVNGMWSPLNVWLGALFLPSPTPAYVVFKYLNIAFGVVALLGMRGLLQKSGLHPRYHLWALLGLLPFSVAATYHELAADWLQCAILLLYLNLVFSEKYRERAGYPLLCGMLGALAYYAKYYNFHFFCLHFTVANFFIFYQWPERRLQPCFWRWTGGGIGMLVLLVLPWVYLLHQKYGFWGLNYTGKFDLAWSLDPELVRRHTKSLLPPTLPGAASYLEDPIWLQHTPVSPFTSLAHFKRQLRISVQSIFSLESVLVVYSSVLVAVAAYYLFRFVRGGFRKDSFERHAVLLCATMPAGYFLFHFEQRFLWPVAVLGYILGWLLLVRRVLPRVRRRWQRTALAFLYTATFCVSPLQELARNQARNDAVQETARQLAPYRLHGVFIANTDQNNMMRLAYLTGLSLAVRSEQNTSAEDLMDDILQYRVNYYLEFADGPALLPCAVTGQLAEVTGGRIPGLKIYRLQ